MLNASLALLLSKGNEVNIPQPWSRYFYGNINEQADVGGRPGKSSLFFLTAAIALESVCLEIGLARLVKDRAFCGLRRPPDGPGKGLGEIDFDAWSYP